MATLRETMQAKIMSLEADLTTAKTELAKLETSGANILEQDIEAIKTWWATVAKHINL